MALAAEGSERRGVAEKRRPAGRPGADGVAAARTLARRPDLAYGSRDGEGASTGEAGRDGVAAASRPRGRGRGGAATGGAAEERFEGWEAEPSTVVGARPGGACGLRTSKEGPGTGLKTY